MTAVVSTHPTLTNSVLTVRCRPSQRHELLRHRLHLTEDHMGQSRGSRHILSHLVFKFRGGRERAAPCTPRGRRVRRYLRSETRHRVHGEGHRPARPHGQHATNRDTSYRCGTGNVVRKFCSPVPFSFFSLNSFFLLSSLAQRSHLPPTSSSPRSAPPRSA